MKTLFKKHIGLSEVAAFTSHLAEFIRAGLPLLQSLELLEKETTRPAFRPVIRDLISRIRKGESLSGAMKHYPKIFSPFYLSLIHAGETGGKQEQVLDRLTTSLEKELDMRSKVGLALAYPSLILAFGIFTICFLFAFIVPKISAIYTDFGGNFPWITRVVLQISWGFQHFGLWILPLAGILVLYGLSGKGAAQCRRSAEGLRLALPWVRDLELQSEVARFSRTLGMLIESGVPLMSGVGLAVNTVANYRVRLRMEGLEKGLAQGKGLVEVLRQKNIFPERALNLIWVGESSGRLDQSLQKLGQMAEKEVDNGIKLVTTLLEPLMILAVGLVVAVIVVSLLLPIFEMSLLVG